MQNIKNTIRILNLAIEEDHPLDYLYYLSKQISEKIAHKIQESVNDEEINISIDDYLNSELCNGRCGTCTNCA